MSYSIGVDLGTTFTAAAVINSGDPTMLGLGNRAFQVPSVLYLADDGTWLVGEAAERRARIDPDRVVREFKRRIGDPVPVLVAGRPFAAQTLTARLLGWVLERATERQGGPPDTVVLTHPANWSQYKLDLLRQAAAMADVSAALLCSEPEAAARHYASRTAVAEGERIVVFDLGGGTFDVCVLSRRDSGFQLLGRPEGVEHLGGIDFDEAVFRHIVGGFRLDLDSLDPTDPGVVVALDRLRRDCVEAKEALSTEIEAVVPFSLGGRQTSVRITRAELEDLIRSALEETIAATGRALRSAGVGSADIGRFVLVGGSSRIPLVAEMLVSAFRCPVAIDTHPKHDVAMGAARTAEQHRGVEAGPASTTTGPDPTSLSAAAPSTEAVSPSTRQRRSRIWLAAILGALVAVATVVVVAVVSSGHDSGGTARGQASAVASSPGPTPSAPPVQRFEISVDSKVRWTSTAINLSGGEDLRFTATGEISDDQTRPNQHFTPDGANRDPVQDVHSNDPYLAFPHAGLLARIGDRTPFYVGRALNITGSDVPAGPLSFTIDDSVLTDNNGAYTVTVEVTAARPAR
jgi:actin-like ATPase involved in cell morphogenesis